MPDRRRKRPRDPAPARQADDRYCLSDGHKAYLEGVEGAFGSDIDYAMLVKIYGPAPEGARRYGPAECLGAINDADRRQSRSQARQHVLCRAAKSQRADAHSAVYAAD